MPGPRFVSLSTPRAFLGLALVLLLAGGLGLAQHASRPAESASVGLRAAAHFLAPGRLAVAVIVTNNTPGELTGPLQVELLGAGGRVLRTARQDVSQKPALAAYRFELLADQARAGSLSVRLRLGKQTRETALAPILLAKGHETTLSAGEEFHAGSQAALRCDVHGVRGSGVTLPLPAAQVVVRLIGKDKKAVPVADARTGYDGRADLQFSVPDVHEGQYTLEVATTSPLGAEILRRNVTVRAPLKILLVTDRPVYQPGQLMHLRGLVLRPINFRPIADAMLLFEVEDGKGNKVFKKAVRTSSFGVAWADFQLADEVNEGDYHIHAALGNQHAEKTVTVKHYVLPRFKVQVTANKKFYLPKETVKVELQSDYFFGKPVANAKVEVTASTFDVAFRQFHKWRGQTDEKGHARFSVKLPDYFVGHPLQNGGALLKLDVKITDTADHGETVVRNYTVSAQPIQVNLIPEGGRIVPDMENRVFVAAIYPDGTPARCAVQLWTGKRAAGKPLATVQTTAAGLAEFRFTPRARDLRLDQNEARAVEMLGGRQWAWGPGLRLDLTARAKDAHGNRAAAVLALTSQPLGENILLRVNRPIYQTGETMAVDVRTSAAVPTVYLDIVRAGQILLSRWLEVKDGRAACTFDMPEHLRGCLGVHAYQVLPTGEIIRDSRAVYVRPRKGLKIAVQANKAVFVPGESGRIRFLVTDDQGKPTQAAMSVLVVDEAVFAVQEGQPGLEKVYFALQEQLRRPRAGSQEQALEGFQELAALPVLSEDKQQVAEVLLTALNVPPPPRWEVNPSGGRELQLRAQISAIGWGLFGFAEGERSVLQQDRKSGRWTFRPWLLESAVAAGNVPADALKAPLGGRLTLEDLARLEKGFTAESLARAVTASRIQTLSGLVVDYTEAHSDRFRRGGRWELPESVLLEVTWKRHLAARWLCDAWGRPLRLLRRDRSDTDPKCPPQLRLYQIVSAGPDGRLDTADDLRGTGKEARDLAAAWWRAGGTTRIDVPGMFRSPFPLRFQPGMVVRPGSLNPNLFLDGQFAGQFGGFQFRGGGFQIGGQIAGFNFGGQIGCQIAGLQFGGAFGGGFGGIGGFQGGGFGPAWSNFGGQFGGGQFGGFNFGGGFQAAGVPGQFRSPFPVRFQPGMMASPRGNGAGPARVREYFPETLLWQPNLVTDEHGVADLAVNLADSITTWRLSASASALQGALGSTKSSLKVFQDFFVEPDLPVNLTQNDEVAFPVAVYNYLKAPQTVKIVLQPEDWFDLIDGRGFERVLQLRPGEVAAVHFCIRAKRIGRQPLTVKAVGSKLSDAVRRLVEVVPNGRKVEQALSGRLSGKVSHVLDIPAEAVPDSAKIMVRIYPGVMAQVLDGVEGMIRLPGG